MSQTFQIARIVHFISTISFDKLTIKSLFTIKYYYIFGDRKAITDQDVLYIIYVSIH